MPEKLEIDFTLPVEDENGEPIQVPKRDDEGNLIEGEGGPETKQVTVGEQLSDFLESGLTLSNNRAGGSALIKIIGNIKTGEQKYTKRSVQIILDTFDKVLENLDKSTGKSPQIMKQLYTFLDQLEERLEGGDNDS